MKNIKNTLNKARFSGKYGAHQRIFDLENGNQGLPVMPSRNSWDRPSASEVWPQHTLFDLTKRQGQPSLTTRSLKRLRVLFGVPG